MTNAISLQKTGKGGKIKIPAAKAHAATASYAYALNSVATARVMAAG